MTDETHEEMPEQELAVEIDLTGAGLTLNEIIEVEDLCDEYVHERSGRFMRAIAYVTGKRANPDLRIEDAGQLEVRFDG